MFQALGSRLQDVFGSLRREVRLTPAAVERTLREIRLALLEADVNFKVVKAFIDRVRDRAVEREVLDSLSPAQQVVAVVRDEMLKLFGDSRPGLSAAADRPRVVLLAGLQGSGKTTTTAKLGRWLAGQGRNPLLVSTDVRRPAALEQLALLGRKAGLRVHETDVSDPVRRAAAAVSEARQLGFDAVLVDTAGRLHLDDELMREVAAVRDAVKPSDVLFVADAMTGQDAVRSAGEFHHRLGVTGVVLAKLDGDARGGAALSVVSVVGVPVTFAATGERLEDLEPFEPQRLVSRLLGMGDVLSLVERAERAIDRGDAEAMAARVRRNELTLDDLKQQLRAVTRMGPLNQVLGMIPGLGSRVAEADVDPRGPARMVAIIDSMTAQERRNPAVMNGSRRRRVARGSGTAVHEVNRLLRQFAQMRKALKAVGGAGRRKGKRRRPAMPAMR